MNCNNWRILLTRGISFLLLISCINVAECYRYNKIIPEKLLSIDEQLICYKIIDINNDKKDEVLLKIFKENKKNNDYDNEIYLKFFELGKNEYILRWQSGNLGIQDEKINVDDKKSSLEIIDINNDSIKEIIASVFFPPYSTLLFIYQWNKKINKWVLITPVTGAISKIASFQSDTGIPDYTIIVRTNGIIECFGRIYSIEPNTHRKIVKYKYQWEINRGYKLIKKMERW